MRIDHEYHHFKGNHLTRSEKVERFVIAELLNTHVPDVQRESSQAWELMHSSSCKALMHVLAEKRGVDVELARIAGALHDYYVIRTGKYSNHAQLGAQLVREELAMQGGFSDSEIALVCEMVANHSDKQIYSDLPHVELLKDADVFDCTLYYGTEFYYLTRKPLSVCREYFKRVLRVREELGMPLPAAFRCLSQEESGVVVDMGELTIAPQPWAPTTAVLGLWALASSSEARDWPIIMAHCHDGIVRWYGPELFLSRPRDGGAPGWRQIRQLAGATDERIVDAEASANSGNVRELLHACQRLLVDTWTGFGASASARERAAVILRDFECDPNAPSKLQSLITQRMTTSLSASEDSPPGAASVDWRLNEDHEQAVDELARFEALRHLRGDAIHGAHRLLVTAGQRVGHNLLQQFPSNALDCADSPRVQDGDDWLAVAWPRFDRVEFTVRTEAQDRFAALLEHFS